MNRMAVNWAYFTPSFARLFAQYNLPSLQTLLMGGEVVTSDDINAWNNRVKVIHCKFSVGICAPLSIFTPFLRRCRLHSQNPRRRL